MFYYLIALLISTKLKFTKNRLLLFKWFLTKKINSESNYKLILLRELSDLKTLKSANDKDKLFYFDEINRITISIDNNIEKRRNINLRLNEII